MPRQRSGSREKIVEAARVLFRRQGYHGTGLAQIIDVSAAPRGSVYFLFPGGKEEIAVSAVQASAGSIPEMIKQTRAASPTAGAWIGTVLDQFAHQLAASEFTDGCPITSITLDSAPSSEALTHACRDAYDAWLTAIADGLRGYGVPPDTAAGLSVTLLSCLEGALVLCRAQQSVQPLHHVAEHLTALVHPHLPTPGPEPGPQ